MKSKVFSVGLVMMFIFTMVAPSVLAASDNYSFTMEHRMVDGSKNGQFLSLDSGSVTISGSHYQSSAKEGATSPQEVHYTLYNKTSGNTFGTVEAEPAPSNGNRESFSGTFTGLGGGTNYYLQIWKTYEDGRTVQGSGTVSN